MFTLIVLLVTVIVLICIFASKKPVKMRCPNCGHEWTMSKRAYMTTPYSQRGVNKLFCCASCGSEGKKVK